MESNTKKAKINEEIFKRLSLRVYREERENFKTQKYKPNIMNERIRKIIEWEVDKDED
jgi:hypothetical protein